MLFPFPRFSRRPQGKKKKKKGHLVPRPRFCPVAVSCLILSTVEGMHDADRCCSRTGPPIATQSSTISYHRSSLCPAERTRGRLHRHVFCSTRQRISLVQYWPFSFHHKPVYNRSPPPSFSTAQMFDRTGVHVDQADIPHHRESIGLAVTPSRTCSAAMLSGARRATLSKGSSNTPQTRINPSKGHHASTLAIAQMV